MASRWKRDFCQYLRSVDSYCLDSVSFSIRYDISTDSLVFIKIAEKFLASTYWTHCVPLKQVSILTKETITDKEKDLIRKQFVENRDDVEWFRALFGDEEQGSLA